MISLDAYGALDALEEISEFHFGDSSTFYEETISIEETFESEINTIRKALRRLEDLERVLDILDCCTNILDDLKGNTSQEEYEFVEGVFKGE